MTDLEELERLLIQRASLDEQTRNVRRAINKKVIEILAANCEGGLTERERAVLGMIRERLQNKEIAAKLHVSLSTAKFHIMAIFRKLGVTSRQQLLGG